MDRGRMGRMDVMKKEGIEERKKERTEGREENNEGRLG